MGDSDPRFLWGGLAGPHGSDVADRLGGGAGDGADVAVAGLDGQGVLGHVDGDGGVGVDAAEGDFLAGDHDDAAVGGPSLHTHRLEGGAGGGGGGGGGGGREGAGRGAQQVAGLGVEVGEGRVSDADRHRLAGEDLGGQDRPAPEADGAAGGHDAGDLGRGAGAGGGGGG